MPETETLGGRLRSLRLGAGLSQGMLAKRVGISTTYISFLENDHRQPSAHVLHRLAAHFGVHPADLRYGTAIHHARRTRLERRAAAQRRVLRLVKELFTGCPVGDTVRWESNVIRADDKHITTITIIREPGDQLLDPDSG
ncbi:hypothetical protein GCM10009733_006300 [Nonomuraea maheshkhaliensis]|uniref:HTH cro/C1-type domain-containing protein n=1 Tax=Nonomuraea maheshkhaliensis TaxID=419590 RepID=A0ABP4QIV1_9ACTN